MADSLSLTKVLGQMSNMTIALIKWANERTHLSMRTLTLGAARALHLAAQGMLQPRRARATKDEVLAAIRRMGVLQIDTISVVARSPYLVLWSRLGDYDPAWLEQLLAEGKLFEYWAHEACFIPVEDYGLYRHRMLDTSPLGWKSGSSWMRGHAEQVERVLEHIRVKGPTRAADFERTDGKSGGWWAWKPEKRSLEALFTAGKVMVARRQNFHRVYDLAERVLPGWDDSQAPAMDTVRREFALRAVKALGLAKAAWIPDYHRTRPPHLAPQALADEGLLLRARVEGWKEPVFVHPDHAGLLESRGGRAPEPDRDHAAVALRPDRLGPPPRAGAVRLRLPAGVLHPGRKAPVRLFHAAGAAPRPTHRAHRRQGAPRGRGVRTEVGGAGAGGPARRRA
jgi:uncharacterized protein YcaQ